MNMYPAVQRADKPKNSILLDSNELLSNFQKGWVYPTRPILPNKPYSYKLLTTVNPAKFWVEIQDPSSAFTRSKVEEACEQVGKEIEKSKCYSVNIDCIVLKMPVLVRLSGKFFRAEVFHLKKDIKQVYVVLVDQGVEQWVSLLNVYAPSKDLLRYPKLALRCQLSQIVPFAKAEVWGKDPDYYRNLQGKQTSVFKMAAMEHGYFNVYLECDKVDVGLNMMLNLGIADLMPLGSLPKGNELVGAYPRLDFTDWIGLKIPAFGTKCVVSDGIVTLHLQLDPALANTIWDAIESLPEAEENWDPFGKGLGDPVLVRHSDGMRYRATIRKKTPDGFLVQLVDYGDFLEAKRKDLFEIPSELVAFPEAATPCIIADLFLTSVTDEMIIKLKQMIPDQNLYCVIGDSNFLDSDDPDGLTRKCLVSLFQPDGELGLDKPFTELLGIPEAPLSQNTSQEFQLISQSLAVELMIADSCYFPGMKYDGIFSCAEDEGSVWIQLEGDDMRAEALTDEMTEFYGNWMSCPAIDFTNETYVAARQNEEDNDDERWYRAKITESDPQRNAYKVFFIDYGNTDVVTMDMIKPLVTYFGQYKAFALQVAIPVNPLPTSDAESIYKFMSKFMVDKELTLEIENANGRNFAWIYCHETSLAHAMEKAGLAKLKNL